MSAGPNTTHGEFPPTQTLCIEVPLSNGKTQPWKNVWPPTKAKMRDVTEAKGQLLLLDGTGGSGSKAVPNNVFIPPKPIHPESDKEDSKEKEDPKSENAKSEK